LGKNKVFGVEYYGEREIEMDALSGRPSGETKVVQWQNNGLEMELTNATRDRVPCRHVCFDKKNSQVLYSRIPRYSIYLSKSPNHLKEKTA
jgi:hypothetical protein